MNSKAFRDLANKRQAESLEHEAADKAWGYSVDEIASFLSISIIDEDGSVGDVAVGVSTSGKRNDLLSDGVRVFVDGIPGLAPPSAGILLA